MKSGLTFAFIVISADGAKFSAVFCRGKTSFDLGVVVGNE